MLKRKVMFLNLRALR